jgi:quinol monooxygenase YgiN
MITLTGHLICTSAAEVALIRAYLPEHIRLSRAEAGCLSFEVSETADPLVWTVRETFTDQAAFEAHQARTRASDWFRATASIQRAYSVTP